MDQSVLVNLIGTALISAIWIVEVLLIIRAFFSWFPGAGSNKFGELVHSLTEPILLPFRRLVSRSSILGNSMLDVSFLVAFLVLEMAKAFIGRVIG